MLDGGGLRYVVLRPQYHSLHPCMARRNAWLTARLKSLQAQSFLSPPHRQGLSWSAILLPIWGLCCMHRRKCLNTHTHTFNSPFSRTTRVRQYQKGKTYLDFTEAKDSEWQWHQLVHMHVCTSLQTDNHASTHHSVFTDRMPFLLPNQQPQSTEGIREMLKQMQTKQINHK